MFLTFSLRGMHSMPLNTHVMLPIGLFYYSALSIFFIILLIVVCIEQVFSISYNLIIVQTNICYIFNLITASH